METRERLKSLIQRRCVLHGDFVLASGAHSTVYFDCKRATLDPEGVALIGEVLWEQITSLPGEVSAVGGPTIGADPIVGHLAALSWQKGRPVAAFLVRKETKSHGTRRQIENPPPPGARVVIFEDVVTSGGSTLDPEGVALIGELLWERITALPGEVKAVGGPTIGADPIVGHLAALSWQKGRPVAAFLVRKETKSHGTRRQIENPPPTGTRVVIFEDVVTSGGSTLDAVRAAEEAGLKVAAIFCLVDREQGGEKALSSYDYRPLFKKSEFGL